MKYLQETLKGIIQSKYVEVARTTGNGEPSASFWNSILRIPQLRENGDGK